MRDTQFDVARTFCVVWIVGFWHLVEYVDDAITEACITPMTRNITNGVLGTFMFISGYFLCKYSFDSKNDIFIFYKKRFRRFYLLFLLSAISFYAVSKIPNMALLLTTITGLSPYLLPQPPTLWFFSILIGFYIVTPLLSKILKHSSGRYSTLLLIGGVIILMLVLWGVNKFLVNIDPRVIWCFPCYVSGLIIGKTKLIKNIGKHPLMEVFICIVYTLSLFFGICGIKFLHIDIYLCVLSILCISRWLSKLPINVIVEKISYASMCVYLFHRILFGFGLNVVTSDFSIGYAWGVMLPFVFISSYLIQWGYDRLILNKK